jgi:hypothetical protein
MAEVGEAGDYTNTTYAHHGTRGSTLPHMDTGVVWTLGKTAQVTWQVLNNHGGGYSYRLCPLEDELTEACFRTCTSPSLPIVGWFSDLLFEGSPCFQRNTRSSLSPRSRRSSTATTKSPRCVAPQKHYSN